MKNYFKEKGKGRVSVATQWKNGFVRIVTLILILFDPLVLGAPIDTEFVTNENIIIDIPKYLKICHKTDKKLDKCIKSSLEKFLEIMNSDTQKLELPHFDPVKIPVLEFQLGSGNVSLHITFKDFRINGFKDFKVLNVKSNLIDNKFEISLENPLVSMTGQFSAEGGVFTFPISGQGDFYLNLTDVSSALIFRLDTVNIKPGVRVYTVEECIVDLIATEINARFGQLIDGSNAIAETFNTFFNDNALEVFTALKPKISRVLADAFHSIADEVLHRYPDDILFPD